MEDSQPMKKKAALLATFEENTKRLLSKFNLNLPKEIS